MSATLKGKFIHVLDAEKGSIKMQGEIVGEDADFAEIRWFSWITGEPTTTELFLRSRVLSSECILYASAAKMNNATSKRPPL